MPTKPFAKSEGFFVYNYTYILKPENFDKIYTGHNKNLERRLIEHNSNKAKSIKNRGPWSLIYKKEFQY
ncbi:MAG: hypothetical protein FJ216_00630 [Ignavibacteria bacterium]|nr:hypothetical protein [Ignavibacteria bacterium]